MEGKRTNAPSNYRNTVVITNFSYTVLSSDRKAKMRKWAQDNQLRVETFVIFKTPANDFTEYFDPKRVVDWSVIHNVDLGKTYAGKVTGVPAKYMVAEKTGGFKEMDAVPTGQPIYYFSPGDMKEAGRDTYWIGKQISDATVVELNRNRWDKFVRDYPTAKPLSSYFSAEKTRLSALLTDDDANYYHRSDAHKHVIKGLNGQNILDPEIASLLTTQGPSANMVAWESFVKRYREVMGFQMAFPRNATTALPSLNKLMDRYPLLRDFFRGYDSLSAKQT